MIERHIHLSGGTPIVLLYEMAKNAGYKPNVENFYEFENKLLIKNNVHNLEEYLNIIHLVDDAQSFPEAIRLSFYEAYKFAYLSGCSYMEMRWNPTKRSQNGKIDLDTLIISARAGYERAKVIFGIKGGMILCLGRDMSEKANEAVFKKVIQYQHKGIIGIDVAGMESSYLELEPYIHMYRTANALDMVTTAHCGETWYENVDKTIAFAIEKLQVKRIGHGIQIYHFPKLMKLAASRKIHFEICITSNLTTGVVKSMKEFKKIFQLFQQNEISYSINTDASQLLQTSLKDEYALYQKILHDDMLEDDDHSESDNSNL